MSLQIFVFVLTLQLWVSYLASLKVVVGYKCNNTYNEFYMLFLHKV